MVTAEFKVAIEQGQIGNNTQVVLVNLNTYGSRYRIDDIAVRVVDNLEQLQRATTISIGVSGSTEYINIPVDNSSRPVRVVDRQLVQIADTQGINQGAYYLYSILTPNQRVLANSALSVYTTDVLIEPARDINNRAIQDYSVLSANVLADRESQFRVQSDRSYVTATSNTNPVNMYSIINDIAIPAQVQDSNYTLTGWTNARYEGAKVTTPTNHNVEPFLNGTFFEGAFFGKDVDDAYITTATAADALYGEYFYSGKLDKVTYTLQDLKTYAYDTGSKFTSLLATASQASNVVPQLTVGDLFRISGSSNGFSREVYEMIAPTGSQLYYPFMNREQSGQDIFYFIQTKRNSNNTLTTTWTGRSYNTTTPENRNLYKIVPIKIYKIEGTTIQPAPEGKLKIKGTNTIVYTNKDGYILSGSSVTFI